MKNKGTTLIELLIGITIIGIISGIFYNLVKIGVRSYNDGIKIEEKLQESRIFILSLCEQLKYADGVNMKDNMLFVNINNKDIIYIFDNNEIIKKVDGKSDVLLDNVRDFKFNMIKKTKGYLLYLELKYGDKENPIRYRTGVFLRNAI